MLENLRGVLDQNAIDALEAELRRNVVGLFRLGQEHAAFARTLQNADWRQRVSRLYYAAYNARRAVQLEVHGKYSTDVSDHSKVDELPDGFPHRERYARQLTDLREDRNLADYSHAGRETDLISPPADYEKLVSDFLTDAQTFLNTRGVPI